MQRNTLLRFPLSIPTFQQAIQRLQRYWAYVGCTVMQCNTIKVLRAKVMNTCKSRCYVMYLLFAYIKSN
ncbi:hypothetical protein R6Q59_026936 [Mikania micrantha]